MDLDAKLAAFEQRSAPKIEAERAQAAADVLAEEQRQKQAEEQRASGLQQDYLRRTGRRSMSPTDFTRGR